VLYKSVGGLVESDIIGIARCQVANNRAVFKLLYTLVHSTFYHAM